MSSMRGYCETVIGDDYYSTIHYKGIYLKWAGIKLRCRDGINRVEGHVSSRSVSYLGYRFKFCPSLPVRQVLADDMDRVHCANILL